MLPFDCARLYARRAGTTKRGTARRRHGTARQTPYAGGFSVFSAPCFRVVFWVVFTCHLFFRSRRKLHLSDIICSSPPPPAPERLNLRPPGEAVSRSAGEGGGGSMRTTTNTSAKADGSTSIKSEADPSRPNAPKNPAHLLSRYS